MIRFTGQPLHILQIERLAFLEARRLQESVAIEIAQGLRPATLLLLEHPHTYTFGRRGQIEHLLWDEVQRQAREIEVHWTDRGGDVTYHGPGQLVAYPILPLGRVDARGHLPQADYLGYVRALEQVILQALAHFGVKGLRVPGKTGVWVARPGAAGEDRESRTPVPAKIASIGVKVDARGISRHGFALNVNPDMSYWQGIIACGLADAQAIALAALVQLPSDMAEVHERIAETFADVFDFAEVQATSPPQSGQPTAASGGAP